MHATDHAARFAASLEAWRRPALTLSVVARLTGLARGTVEELGERLGLEAGPEGPAFGLYSAEGAYLLRGIGEAAAVLPGELALGLADPLREYAVAYWRDPAFREQRAALCGHRTDGGRTWTWTLVLADRWPDGAAAPGPLVVQVMPRGLLLALLAALEAEEPGERPGPPAAAGLH